MQGKGRRLAAWAAGQLVTQITIILNSIILLESGKIAEKVGERHVRTVMQASPALRRHHAIVQ